MIVRGVAHAAVVGVLRVTAVELGTDETYAEEGMAVGVGPVVIMTPIPATISVVDDTVIEVVGVAPIADAVTTTFAGLPTGAVRGAVPGQPYVPAVGAVVG